MAGTRAQVLGSFYCSSLCDLMSVYVEDVSLAGLDRPDTLVCMSLSVLEKT